MRNPFAQFQALLAPGPLQIGKVTAWESGIATIELPGGATLHARGQAAVGDKVFVREGAIEGPAADLPTVAGEI